MERGADLVRVRRRKKEIRHGNVVLGGMGISQSDDPDFSWGGGVVA